MFLTCLQFYCWRWLEVGFQFYPHQTVNVEIQCKGVEGLDGQATPGRWRCNFRCPLTDQTSSYLSSGFKSRRAGVIKPSCVPHSWLECVRTRRMTPLNTAASLVISCLHRIVKFQRRRYSNLARVHLNVQCCSPYGVSSLKGTRDIQAAYYSVKFLVLLLSL